MVSPFWTKFWCVVLGWCVTWPLGSAIKVPEITAAICFLGWPAVSYFMWRQMRDQGSNTEKTDG